MKLDETRAQLMAERAVVRRALKSPDGRALLAHLERIYVVDRIATGDAHTTTVNAAQADVINYLRRLAETEDGE